MGWQITNLLQLMALGYFCTMSRHHLAIFASGTGSNASRIIDHFKEHPSIVVSLVVASKADAGVLNIAKAHNIPTLVLNRSSFRDTEDLLGELAQHSIDFLVLAGFLWLVPFYLVQAFENRIVNIHPALLPKFGGKGMYGINVHRAVLEAGEKESGPTIHLVNEQYDEGVILMQATCPVEENDTPEELAKRVLALEHAHFAPAIEQYLSSGVADS